MTRNEICQLIQRRLAGGDPTDDLTVTLQEINLWLDPAVAASAMKNYVDSVNIDGFEFIGDAYYVTFKNIILALDADSGDYVGTMPAIPVGVPRGYDAPAAYLQSVTPGSMTPMVRLTPQEVPFYGVLPQPKEKVKYWLEGNKVNVRGYDLTDYTGRKVAISMIGSAGKRLLTDELLIPPDYIPFVVEYIQKNFLPTQAMAKDTMNDGNDVK